MYLLNDNRTVVYATEYRGPSVNGDPRSADHPEFTESYAAYSPNGSAEVWFPSSVTFDLLVSSVLSYQLSQVQIDTCSCWRNLDDSMRIV